MSILITVLRTFQWKTSLFGEMMVVWSFFDKNMLFFAVSSSVYCGRDGSIWAGCWKGGVWAAGTAHFSPYKLLWGGGGRLRRLFHRISYFKGVKAFLMGFFKTPHKQAPKSTRNYQGSTAVCKGFDVFFSRLVLLVTLRVFLLTLLWKRLFFTGWTGVGKNWKRVKKRHFFTIFLLSRLW